MASFDSSDSEEEIEYENETFQLRDIEFNITTVSYMPLSKLMKLREKETEISGQKLWCGSLVVIEYLFDHISYIKDHNILELGAGTGVVGMLCQKLGANRVIVSDYDMKSIEHMTNDIQKNNVQEIEILNLNWFDFHINQINTEFLSSAPLRIVAGDVLYKHQLLHPFFQVIKQLLLIPNSSMLLCHVPRAGVEHNDVITISKEYNLSITPISSEFWKKGVCIEYSIPDDYDRAQLYLLESIGSS